MTPAPEGFVSKNYLEATVAAAAGFTETLVVFAAFLCFFTEVVDLVFVVDFIGSCLAAPKAAPIIIERASTAVIVVFMAV
jgi:hypothetical protein